MTVALTFAFTLAHGESFDESIDVPLDYYLASGESPIEDGSSFSISFSAARGQSDSDIRFSTQNASGPRLSIGDFDAPTAKLTLSFQAADTRMRQMAPGDYVGDLLHRRPRGGGMADQVTRVGAITLTLEAGT